MSTHGSGTRERASGAAIRTAVSQRHPLARQLGHIDRHIAAMQRHADAAEARARANPRSADARGARTHLQHEMVRAQAARDRAIGRLSEGMGRAAARIPEIRAAIQRFATETRSQVAAYREMHPGKALPPRLRAKQVELARYQRGDIGEPPTIQPKPNESLKARADRLTLEAHQWRAWEQTPFYHMTRARASARGREQRGIAVRDAERAAQSAYQRVVSERNARTQARRDAATLRAAARNPVYRAVTSGNRTAVRLPAGHLNILMTRPVAGDASRVTVETYRGARDRTPADVRTITRAELARALQGTTLAEDQPSLPRRRATA